VRVLVTNDDGVDSPELLALACALEQVASVDVVAPSRNQSGVSRSFSLENALAVDEVRLTDGRAAFSVSGTPVDCVRFGVLGLTGQKPDIVCAGINRGANLGDDVHYSGTVAAALEAHFLGVPGIAFSQLALADGSYDVDAICAAAVRLVALAPALDVVLNVNGPALPASAVHGVRVARLGRRIYELALSRHGADSPDGRRHFRLYDTIPTHHVDDGTDFSAIEDGWISVTPLTVTGTDHAASDRVRELVER
jgi:5'-nucleotidase